MHERVTDATALAVGADADGSKSNGRRVVDEPARADDVPDHFTGLDGDQRQLGQPAFVLTQAGEQQRLELPAERSARDRVDHSGVLGPLPSDHHR